MKITYIIDRPYEKNFTLIDTFTGAKVSIPEGVARSFIGDKRTVFSASADVALRAVDFK